MLKRILIAVDDSAPALAAAELAIEFGHDPSTELHFVTITEAGRTTDAMLRHIAALAERAGLSPTFTDIPDGGNPFEQLLATAHEWNADLVMMGRSDVRRPGAPYVGSVPNTSWSSPTSRCSWFQAVRAPPIDPSHRDPWLTSRAHRRSP